MLTQLVTPEILASILGGTFFLFLIGSLGGSLLFLRRLKTMQTTMQQLHTSTQEQIQQLQTAQAATQGTVTTTQQETRHFMQDQQALQRHSQNLMHEIKTQQSSTQAVMAEWKKDTTQLSRALRTTYQQGIWGEHELKRVVEFAGMREHCDFDLQHKFPNRQQPDMLIYLHNNRTIAVDSKAPSQAYVNAMDSEDETTRTARLKDYARNVRDIMSQLAKKEYWKQIEPPLALVILFIPNEAMFRAALEHDTELLNLATEKSVLLASPVTLIALLKALSYGWSQEERAQHVQQIVDQSKDLHKELEAWLRQWQPLRKAIHNVTIEYNQVTNHYQTHILPHLQALSTLDSTLHIKDKAFDLKPLPPSTSNLEGEQSPPPPVEEAATPSSEAVQADAFWRQKVLKQFKKWKELFIVDVPIQEKGKDLSNGETPKEG